MSNPLFKWFLTNVKIQIYLNKDAYKTTLSTCCSSILPLHNLNHLIISILSFLYFLSHLLELNLILFQQFTSIINLWINMSQSMSQSGLNFLLILINKNTTNLFKDFCIFFIKKYYLMKEFRFILARGSFMIIASIVSYVPLRTFGLSFITGCTFLLILRSSFAGVGVTLDLGCDIYIIIFIINLLIYIFIILYNYE